MTIAKATRGRGSCGPRGGRGGRRTHGRGRHRCTGPVTSAPMMAQRDPWVEHAGAPPSARVCCRRRGRRTPLWCRRFDSAIPRRDCPATAASFRAPDGSQHPTVACSRNHTSGASLDPGRGGRGTSREPHPSPPAEQAWKHFPGTSSPAAASSTARDYYVAAEIGAGAGTRPSRRQSPTGAPALTGVNRISQPRRGRPCPQGNGTPRGWRATRRGFEGAEGTGPTLTSPRRGARPKALLLPARCPPRRATTYPHQRFATKPAGIRWHRKAVSENGGGLRGPQ